jgi:uncharacterized protein (TIGR03382 family)
MVRDLLLGCSLIAATASHALANGRPPATSTISFRQGNEREIVVGLTFGAVVSRDNGATWYWFCEDAIGYGGTYDPVFALSPTGATFATTFNSLNVSRDGCTFTPVAPMKKFVSAIALGPDHALYAAASDPADTKIYKSVDDGAGFPTSVAPGQTDDYWQTLAVAPSRSQRVYLSGYRVAGARTYLLFQSDDGGASFQPMIQTGFTPGPFSIIEIAGVSATNPDHVFARIKFENVNGDGIYRHTSGGIGGTWTAVMRKQGPIAFVARANGDLVAGTTAEGSFVSHDNGDTWLPLAGAPHIGCLTENTAGEVWACTQNYSETGDGDDAGVMKSTDLATWTRVLRYQDITAPADCAAGTAQHDSCLAMWCGLRRTLGITSTAVDCPSDADGAPPPKDPGGCCQTGGDGAPATAVLGLGIAIVVLRRRRR